jgi:hypothetical protein
LGVYFLLVSFLTLDSTPHPWKYFAESFEHFDVSSNVLSMLVAETTIAFQEAKRFPDKFRT